MKYRTIVVDPPWRECHYCGQLFQQERGYPPVIMCPDCTVKEFFPRERRR